MAERVEPTGVRLRAQSAADDGARRSFLALIDSELDRSYRLAAVILGDRGEAEDVVHDAAEKAWRGWSNLRDPARAPAWFGRIVINLCRDRLRRRGRRRLLEVIRSPLPREHPTVTDASEPVGARDLLDRALGRLTPDEQIVISLRYEQDMTVPAIAGYLGIAPGTVKSRLHHALGHLRAALEEQQR